MMRIQALAFSLSTILALGSCSHGLVPAGGGGANGKSQGGGGAPGAFTTTVRFVNRGNFQRREWGLATVPFPEGIWTQAKQFRPRGTVGELTPFGARWPDGSVRFAQLAAALDLPPATEVDVVVEEGAPTLLPFALGSWLAKGLPNFAMKFEVGVPGIGPRLSEISSFRIEHDTESRKVVYLGGYVPDTDLVFDLWLTFFSGQDQVAFELKLVNSSVQSTQWKQDVDYVRLWTMGAVPYLRAANRRGAVYGPLSPAGPNGVQLLDSTFFYDGQGQDWWGELFFAYPTHGQGAEKARLESFLAALEMPCYGMSTDWAASGAYGPFGHLAAVPAWIQDGGRAATLANRANYVAWAAAPGNPWDDMPMGLLAHASNTGDQNDFGVGKLLDVYCSGLPDGIEEARLNAGEEACRPVHHREHDGSPVLAANHPNWVAWNGRTHFNTTISPDRLGKPVPEPWLDAHSWSGRDNQHWSSLLLANACLLTGSWSLRAELDNEGELYLASQTIPSQKPGWSTNIIDTPRAVGRTLLSMSWNYLVTGRTDLRDRMAARTRECIAVQWTGGGVGGPVKPCALATPDPRVLMITHWTPWEDSLAIPGLEACYLVTGELAARQIAIGLARSLLEWGWKITPNEIIIATGVGWKGNGLPLTALEYTDPNWVLWSYGTGFNLWGLPSTKIAQRYALALNDQQMLTRANTVLSFLQTRQPPRNGGFDRFVEWDCVF